MRTIPFLGVGGLALLLAGCADEAPVAPSSEATPNQRSTSAQQEENEPRAHWRARSDSALWAAIEPGGIAIVGLRTPGRDRGVERGKVTISEAEQLRARGRFTAIEGLTILERDTLLPILRVAIRDRRALAALRRLPHVDYVEPQYNFETSPAQFFQSGCAGGGFGGYIGQLPDGDIYGWNLASGHNIPQAWNLASGAGITVGVVDTGIDPLQPQLNDEFDDGWSSGRWIRSTRGPDQCGHGTHVAGVIAAPRDGRNVVGIAWGSNLYSVRVNNNPWANFLDANLIRDGIREAVGFSLIVVMAFGDVFGHSSIQDEIQYSYYNFGRMFTAASGGFPDLCQRMGLPAKCQPGVMFPARLPEVLAIVGQDYGCRECLYGHEVDFTTTPPTATTGARTLGHPDIGTNALSSGATAQFAGIAALTWSKYPSWTRDQVVDRLRVCSTNGSWKSTKYGWGITSAYCAVGGVELIVGVSGPTGIYRFQSAQYTATVTWRVTAPTQPFTYQWRSRATTSYGTGSWSPWYSTGTQNYTYMSVNSCGILRNEIQVRATDANGVVGESSALPVGVLNPC